MAVQEQLEESPKGFIVLIFFFASVGFTVRFKLLRMLVLPTALLVFNPFLRL
jgi:hypothetical protein